VVVRLTLPRLTLALHCAAVQFEEVVRRRRMVRTYTEDPVPRRLVDRVLDAGLRAPSAGFSQGWAFLVLEGAEQTDLFWRATERPGTAPEPGGRLDRQRQAPVVIVPFAHKEAYLQRYAEPDKAGLGLDREEAWPVPFWEVDTAFATMSMLLAATDAGLGALFFGLFDGGEGLHATFGIPHGYRPIGAISIGWPAPGDPRSPSLARGWRERNSVVHYGKWRPPT